MTNTAKTWDEWKDPIGQTYRPGDLIAVAVINGRSPQLVIGQVIQINRVNSKGEEIMASSWKRDSKGDYEKDENGRMIRVTEPSCTVKLQPLIDGRDFYRSGKPRAVTYLFPGNIVRVPNLWERLQLGELSQP